MESIASLGGSGHRVGAAAASLLFRPRRPRRVKDRGRNALSRVPAEAWQPAAAHTEKEQAAPADMGNGMWTLRACDRGQMAISSPGSRETVLE